MTQHLDFEINAVTMRKYFSVEETQQIRARILAVCHTVKTRQVTHTVWRSGGWHDRTEPLKHYQAGELAPICFEKLQKEKVSDVWVKILYMIKKEAVRNLRIANAT